jgi:hypothetical protein
MSDFPISEFARLEQMLRAFCEKMELVRAFDELTRRAERLSVAGVTDAGEFKEGEHPRDKDGKFGSGGGSEKQEESVTSDAEKQRKAESVKIDPNRDVNELPRLNKEDLKTLGKEDKPVFLHRRVIEKHPEVSAEDAPMILGNSLYRPEAVLPGNPDKSYFNFITRIGEDKSSVVLLDVEDKKEGFEVVNFHYLKDRTRAQKERKAVETERKGG